MKQLLSLLLLLLSLALVLTSCATSSTPDDSTESESASETETESNQLPKEVYGIWYSHDTQAVLDLTDLSNVTYYVLKVGYYLYEESLTCTATMEDDELTLYLGEEETRTLTFEPYQDVLTDNNGTDPFTYVRKNELPKAYLALPFPDFSKLGAKELVQLGSHTGLKLPATETELAEAADAYTAMFGSMSIMNAPMVTDRPAQTNDFVNIDYTGYLDGKAFENGSATGADLMLSTNSGYIPGFAEGIVGHTVGETFNVKVIFPSDYHQSSLAGKETVFTMTLNAIYDVRGAYLWMQVSEGTTVSSYPEESYRYFLQQYQDTYHMYAYYYGMEYEVFLMMYGISEDAMVEAAKANAANFLSVFSVIETYGLDITSEVNALTEAMVTELMENNEMTREEASKYVEENNLYQVRAQAACTTVLNWLLQENAAS